MEGWYSDAALNSIQAQGFEFRALFSTLFTLDRCRIGRSLLLGALGYGSKKAIVRHISLAYPRFATLGGLYGWVPVSRKTKPRYSRLRQRKLSGRFKQ